MFGSPKAYYSGILLLAVLSCSISLSHAGCTDASDGCDVGFYATTCDTSTCCLQCATAPASIITGITCNFAMPAIVDCSGGASSIDLTVAFQNTDPNCVPEFSIVNECQATIQNNQYLTRQPNTMCSNVTCVIGVALSGNQCSSTCSDVTNNAVVFAADTAPPTIDITQDAYPITLTSCDQMQALVTDLNTNASWLFASTQDACSGVLRTNVAWYTITTPCGTQQKITLSRRATDTCGNTATYTSSYWLPDTTAPQPATELPSWTITQTCATANNSFSSETVLATDGARCIGANATTSNYDSVVTSSDTVISRNCNNQATVMRSWVFADSCGNTQTISQTIIINDTVAPTITPPTIPRLHCRNELNNYLTPLTGHDNCDGSMQSSAGVITYEPASATSRCENRGSGAIQWTITDSCGNSNTVSAGFNLADSIPPAVVSGMPATEQRFQCHKDATSADTIQVQDNCLGTWNVTATMTTQTARACVNQYTATRRWHITDNCTAPIEISSTTIVADTVAPVFTPDITQNAHTVVQCRSNIPQAPTQAATDNCGGEIVVRARDLVIESKDKRCANRAVIQRQWSAVDECRNAATFTQTFTINDTQAPQILNNHTAWSQACIWPVNNMYVCFSNISKYLNAWGADNCGNPVQLHIDSCLAWDCSTPDGSKCAQPARPSKASKPVCVISNTYDLFCIRAERIATKQARLYAVNITASDDCGNKAAPITLSFLVPGGGSPADQIQNGTTACENRTLVYVPVATNLTATSYFGVMYSAESVTLPSVSSATNLTPIASIWLGIFVLLVSIGFVWF